MGVNVTAVLTVIMPINRPLTNKSLSIISKTLTIPTLHINLQTNVFPQIVKRKFISLNVTRHHELSC